VNEKFFALCETFGAEKVGMMTGDAAINREAPIICCTAEILSNLCLREDRVLAEWVVMDEFHYYADKDRGVAWQVPLLSMRETGFLLMSATLGDTTAITTSLHELTHREVAEVRSATRPVPLEFTYAETALHETVSDLLTANRAPIYLVNFSQRAAAEQAQNLMSIELCTKDEKERLKDSIGSARFDTPFGKDLKRLLLHGVGLHHAGLLPRYRRLVERLAQSGQLKVVSGTDTLGVGVNIPIRTVLFTQLCKFDGEKTAVLTVRDFLQIAGRAGRKGFDEQGFVVAQAPAHVIDNARLAQKKEAGKKVVMQKPPTKGYAHWDKNTFLRLTQDLPEALEPRFTLSHGLILNLLQSGQQTKRGGYSRLVELVKLSHTRPVIKVRLLKQARLLFRALLGAGIVHHEKRTGSMHAHLHVDAKLQKDFSLHHTLSLYLHQTVPKLDKASPTYHLDLLTLVESVLENPEPALWAQLDKAKGEKIAELKAQGMEYDERMAELEKVEYPKPNAEFIYGTFNDFAAQHPWVGQENIRPKSVARELFELCATFNDYVREYGVQRSEGVLLRYLSETYKTLDTNVPADARTEGVDDILGFLLTTLRQVDSSLLDEWLVLKEGGPAVAATEKVKEPPRRDLAARPKELAARVRAELHRFVTLISRAKWEDAAELLPAGDGWTTERLETEVKARGAIDSTPRARAAHLTQLTPEEPRVWAVRHNLLNAEGEDAGYLDCMVDLRGTDDPDGALVHLLRVAE
jgi:superfamily II RNA helicase